jgi:hypothetical protein
MTRNALLPSNLKARRAAPPTSNSLPYAFPQFAIRNPQFEIIFPLPPTSNREAHLPYAL